MIAIKKFKILTFGFLSLALILAACSAPVVQLPDTGDELTPTAVTPALTTPAGVNPLLNTRWSLQSWGAPGAEITVLSGTGITLAFDEPGRAGGNSGCNSYSAPYTIQGDQLKFGETISTLMACAGQGVNDQERQYLEALRSAGRFSIAGERLTIWYNGGQKQLNFVIAPAATQTLPAPSASQPERVQFAPGESSIRLSEELPNGPAAKQYVLTASAGQTMTVDVTSVEAPLSMTITTPKGVQRIPEMMPAQGGGYRIGHQFVLPDTGDYLVTLTKAGNTPDTHYFASFRIEALASPVTPTSQATPALQRIRFAAGATSATVSGHLPASGSALYVLRALQGQTLTAALSFSQGQAILVIWGADGNVLISDHAEVFRFQGVLPSTQDYYIQLKGNPDRATDYSLQVTIPPLGSNAPTPAPTPIEFAPGTSSATVSGRLAASESHLYKLYALQGQTLKLDLTFSQGRAILVVWGQDGTVLQTDHTEVTHLERILPSSQTYFVRVAGRPEGPTHYSLKVTIPPQ